MSRRKYDKRLMIGVFFLLYMYQGLLFGLNEGFRQLLKAKHVRDAELAWIGLAPSPFYLKFLIAPVMDTKFSRKFGKRFSWIVPISIISTSLYFVFAEKAQEWLDKGDAFMLFLMNFIQFLFVATQDVAIDGMVCEVLNEEDFEKGTLMQTLGQSIGPMIACNVFILLVSPEYAKARFNRDSALVSIPGFLRFLGMFIFAATAVSYFAVNESHITSEEQTGVPHEEQSFKELVSLIPRMFTDISIRKLLVIPALYEPILLFTDVCVTLKFIEIGFGPVFLSRFELYFFLVDLCMIFVLGRLNILESVWKYYKIAIDVLFVNVTCFWLFYFFVPKNGWETVWISFMVFYKMVRYFGTMKFTAAFVYIQYVADKTCGGSYLTISASAHNFCRLNLPNFLLGLTKITSFPVVLFLTYAADIGFRLMYRQKWTEFFSSSSPELFKLKKLYPRQMTELETNPTKLETQKQLE